VKDKERRAISINNDHVERPFLTNTNVTKTKKNNKEESEEDFEKQGRLDNLDKGNNMALQKPIRHFAGLRLNIVSFSSQNPICIK
jgi:hypothetical protein